MYDQWTSILVGNYEISKKKLCVFRVLVSPLPRICNRNKFLTNLYSPSEICQRRDPLQIFLRTTVFAWEIMSCEGWLAPI